MSNLPVVPGVPSSAEVDAMKRAMAAVHGNVPTVHETQAHYSGGHAGTRRTINETASTPYHPSYGTSAEDVQQMKNLLERLEQINGVDNMISESAGSGFEAITVISENAGEAAKSSVVQKGTRKALVADLALQESAVAIVKLLSRGENLESSKAQQVLALDEEYAQAKAQAATIKDRYQRSVQLGETESATVFKKRHAAVRANAQAIQEELKALIATIR